MSQNFKPLCFLLVLFLSFPGFAQEDYAYTVDLEHIPKDGINVELRTPAIEASEAVFSIPKIIPGTYGIADYGKFISEVKAFDKEGKALGVTKMNDNQWKISNAGKLNKITYRVDDVYDTEIKHNIYPMAATNFEEGKNMVLNLPGVLGFIDG